MLAQIAAEGSTGSLGSYLKERRRQLPREAAVLGPYPRPPHRVGSPVTQEEVAEVLGVSRVWYACVESDKASRASARLLRRIADAFAFDASQRLAMIRLAFPGLSSQAADNH